MKFFISFDLEGMPGVVSGQDYEKNFSLHQKVIARSLRAVLDGMNQFGELETVVISDAHAWGYNIPFEDLPPKVLLFRGVPKDLGMVEGIDRGFDGLILLGYHAKAGEPFSTLDHTYSSKTFYSINLNGEELSEATLNVAIAGHFAVPLILAVGDDKLVKEVKKKINPKVPTVVTKYSVSRLGAFTRSIEELEGELKEKTRLAIERRKEMKPFRFSYPCELRFHLLDTAKADIVSLIPNTKRIGGRQIYYKAKDIIEVNRIIRLAAILGLAAQEFYK